MVRTACRGVALQRIVERNDEPLDFHDFTFLLDSPAAIIAKHGWPMRARFQRGVWTLHSFRLLISASMISIFGSLITSTAFPFIAIQQLDAGPKELALLSLAGIVPSVVLGSIAGIWIDRMSRRMVMIASDLISAGALLTIPVAIFLTTVQVAMPN